MSSHVTTSGQSQTSFACLHRQPQLWIKACWTQLGHSNKMINKKQAYRSVNCYNFMTVKAQYGEKERKRECPLYIFLMILSQN